jgi:hypothetical protein
MMIRTPITLGKVLEYEVFNLREYGLLKVETA